MTMRLCLVEDGAVGRLHPLTHNRPAFDLRLGMTTLGHKVFRAFGVGPGPARRGLILRPELVAWQLARDPRTPVNDPDWLARGRTLVVNARWLAPETGENVGLGLDFAAGDWIALCDGLPAAAWVGPGEAIGLASGNVDGWFEELLSRRDVATIEVAGDWVEIPQDLIDRTPWHVERDLRLETRPEVSNRQLASASVIGPVRGLSLHELATIEPYVVLDTTNGPIRIASGATVRAFSRVEGPCSIGPDCDIRRAELRGGVSLGPRCRVGGNLIQSTLLGDVEATDAAHIAHAYLGEGVVVGARSVIGDDSAGTIVPDRSHLAPGSIIEPGTIFGSTMPEEPILRPRVRKQG